MNRSSSRRSWFGKRAVLPAALLLLAALTADSAPGDLDMSFDEDGIVTHHGAAGGNGDDAAAALALQSDGKIVGAGGSASSSEDQDGNSGAVVWRYDTNGALDPTFDGDGIVRIDTHFFINDVAIQGDGKILLAGYLYGRVHLYRLEPDGSLDAAFGDGGVASAPLVFGLDYGGDIPYRIALQADGKIVLTGSVQGVFAFLLGLWRFTSDGDLDATFDGDGIACFGPGQGFYAGGVGVAIQPDGRIVATGRWYNDVLDGVLVLRVNENGSLDPTFEGDGIVIHAGRGFGGPVGWNVGIDNGGNIVVVGHDDGDGGGGSGHMLLWRFLSSGLPDPSFDGDGWLSYGDNVVGYQGLDVGFQRSGRILVMGARNVSLGRHTGRSDVALWRFKVTGAPDGTFGTAGVSIFQDPDGVTQHGLDMALQADQKILVAGARSGTGDQDMALWRFDSFGGGNPQLPVTAVVTSGPRTATPAPVAANTAFAQIEFAGGGMTSGRLASAANGNGSGANYAETTALANARDTVSIPIWTNQSSLSLFVGVRSDTESLAGTGLPAGIPNNGLGRSALGATALLVEFADSTGNLLGDSVTTTSFGESFAYSLIYNLSETTVASYARIGFDTFPGSRSFAFYYADTYGAAWVRDDSVTVIVEAGVTSGTLIVRCVGITKDLPGGLGGVSAASGSATVSQTGAVCLVARLGLPSAAMAFLRQIRDGGLESALGRLLVHTYYAFAS